MAIKYSNNNQGRQITLGTGTPASNSLTGVLGDVYFNSSDGVMWKYITAWTQVGIGEYSAKVAITIGAITSAPTKATTPDFDYTRSRLYSGEKWYQINSLYSKLDTATGAAAGTGNYLFTLADSLSFDTAEHPYYTGTDVLTTNVVLRYAVPESNSFVAIDGFLQQVAIIPYDATRYRLLAYTDNGNGLNAFIGSASYNINANDCVYNLDFKIKTT